MDFPSIEYIDWFIETMGTEECDLATSSVPDLGSNHPITPPAIDVSHYGNGTDVRTPFLEAVARTYGSRPEDVMECAGTSMANYLVATALLGPGDVCLIERPVYEPLRRVVELAGSTIHYVERDPDTAELTLQGLEQSWKQGTRLVIVTSPHNPSGAIIPEHRVKELASFCEDQGAHLLVDEVFADLNPDRPRAAHVIHESAINTTSLTKCYGLGDIRCGWIMGPEEIISRCRRLNWLMGVIHSSATLAIGTSVLEHRDEVLSGFRSHMDTNRNGARSWLARTPGVNGTIHPSSLFCFIDIDGVTEDLPWVNRFIAEHRTRVVPGTFFMDPGKIRLSFGAEKERFDEGLQRLSRFLGSPGA